MTGMRRSVLWSIVVLLCVGLTPALAQEDPSQDTQQSETEELPAILVADQVVITPERQLIAEGNVEAFQGETRLTASRIIYDDATGKMTIEGPIRIDEGDGIIVLANAAEMDRGLQNGLLTGARMVFEQQLQLAALQMTRVGGRYTQLYKTAVTSCHVCENGKPPLWQIRARTVTHDQEERQLYFEDATLRVLDVPIFYFPGMRLPDPTLERATGFLIPSFRTTTQLSTGIYIPYFIRIGDSKDLTITPYLSTKTRTLGLRYRQAFRNGGIEFNGAFTRDDLYEGEDRGYLFGEGGFDFANDYRLEFDIKTVSDNAYLYDYGLEDLDRLRSQISLDQIRRDSAFYTDLIHYSTLRDSDNESELPTRIGDIIYQKRFFPTAIGGEVRVTADGHAHYRSSDTDVLGRDIARFTADVNWRKNWILGNGLRADWEMGVAVDRFKVEHDSNYPPNATLTTPRAALTLSYPMTKTAASGAVHYLNPVMQLGWADVHGPDVPNDESTFVEFDQGNLLALSRFPSPDRREEGSALVLGVNWARYGTDGWNAFATVGQVFRKTAIDDFSTTSGLSGTSSDLLLAGQIRMDAGLSLTARGLLSGDFDFNKAEFRGDWLSERTVISGSYIWLGIDADENRTSEVSEFWFDGSYRVDDYWTASANLRYDIADDTATRAGIGLVYQNECVTIDLSLNRSFTSSSSVEPTTDFGFTIALSGFSVDNGAEKYRRSCKHS